MYSIYLFFFLILTLCFLIPFCNNISDDGIDGIKETFYMFKDKDFYLNVIIPAFINFGSIFIFFTLFISVGSLVLNKINL